MRQLTRLTPFAALLLVACSASETGTGGPSGGMPPTKVETVIVQPRDLPDRFETVGTLRAIDSIVLRPEVAGRIDALHFIEGQSVAAGQVLFTLDDDLARAALNEADANLTNSRRAYDRATELASKQLIARSDVDSTQATLSVDQARLASARARLEKTQIRAPFAGRVGLREVSIGDYVQVGQALVDLVRLDPIEVELRVPEVEMSRLALGQKVELGVDAYRDQVFVGAISTMSPTIDPANRSVTVRARFDNPNSLLAPGASASVRIVYANNPHALLVPEQAIWPNGEEKAVYRVDKGVAKLVPVTLGVRVPGLVEVRSGLNPGDVVVTAGQLKLHDGAPVSVVPANHDR